jgi:hypothetical protein
VKNQNRAQKLIALSVVLMTLVLIITPMNVFAANKPYNQPVQLFPYDRQYSWQTVTFYVCVPNNAVVQRVLVSPPFVKNDIVVNYWHQTGSLVTINVTPMGQNGQSYNLSIQGYLL